MAFNLEIHGNLGDYQNNDPDPSEHPFEQLGEQLQISPYFPPEYERVCDYHRQSGENLEMNKEKIASVAVIEAISKISKEEVQGVEPSQITFSLNENKKLIPTQNIINKPEQMLNEPLFGSDPMAAIFYESETQQPESSKIREESTGVFDDRTSCDSSLIVNSEAFKLDPKFPAGEKSFSTNSSCDLLNMLDVSSLNAFREVNEHKIVSKCREIEMLQAFLKNQDQGQRSMKNFLKTVGNSFADYIEKNFKLNVKALRDNLSQKKLNSYLLGDSKLQGIQSEKQPKEPIELHHKFVLESFLEFAKNFTFDPERSHIQCPRIKDGYLIAGQILKNLIKEVTDIFQDNIGSLEIELSFCRMKPKFIIKVYESHEHQFI